MARKEKPIYEKIPTTGELVELDGTSEYLRNNNGFYSPESNNLTMSVYSDFIPLLYLTSGLRAPRIRVSQNSYLNIVGIEEEKYVEEDYHKWREKYLSGVISGYYDSSFSFDKNQNIIGLHYELKRWIEMDSRMDVENLIPYPSHSWSVCDRTAVLNRMGRFQIGSSCQRTYRVGTSAFSLYLANNRQWTPHVLAVVLPENYIYLKYKLLTQNVLDLSKVIILIDRELDTTTFPKQPFRRLYREGMMPHIMKSACDVWKVPQSFIKEKCFVEPFSLRGIGPLERKRVLDQLIEGFINSLDEKKEKHEAFSNRLSTGIFEQLADIGGPYSISTNQQEQSSIDYIYAGGIDPTNTGEFRNMLETTRETFTTIENRTRRQFNEYIGVVDSEQTIMISDDELRF